MLAAVCTVQSPLDVTTSRCEIVNRRLRLRAHDRADVQSREKYTSMAVCELSAPNTLSAAKWGASKERRFQSSDRKIVWVRSPPPEGSPLFSFSF